MALVGQQAELSCRLKAPLEVSFKYRPLRWRPAWLDMCRRQWCLECRTKANQHGCHPGLLRPMGCPKELA